jgi:tRNA dimethylallyltransferase
MLDCGFVEEVRGLLDSGVPADASGLDGLGYREVVAFLNGEIAVGELAGAIAASTRRYAKRQETWFRHQLGDVEVLLVDATDDPDTLAERICGSWEKRRRRCGSG